MTPSSAALNSNTILLVDDDQSILEFFCKRLDQAGCTTVTAPDGLAVIDMLPRLAADIVILDSMPPKVHGLEVLEAVRADTRHKDIPVGREKTAPLARSANLEMA